MVRPKTFNAYPPESVNHPSAFGASPIQTPAPESPPAGMSPSPLDPSPPAKLPPPGSSLNVLGEPLLVCGCQPSTGWFRDGYCRTDPADLGRHTVCCVVSEAFLAYTRAQGNDLSTPAPAYGFPGLKPGDAWCVCARRWLEAYEDGMAPPVRLEACESSTLEVIPLELLKQHSLT